MIGLERAKDTTEAAIIVITAILTKTKIMETVIPTKTKITKILATLATASTPETKTTGTAKVMDGILTPEIKITVTQEILRAISIPETKITIMTLVTLNVVTTIEDEILATAIIIALSLITRKNKQLGKPIMLTNTHDRETPSHPRINGRLRG